MQSLTQMKRPIWSRARSPARACLWCSWRCVQGRTAEQVGQNGAGRLVASVVPEPAAGAAHEERRPAAVEAPEAARREVLLAAAVAEVHEKLVSLQRRRQLRCGRHPARHTLRAQLWDWKMISNLKPSSGLQPAHMLLSLRRCLLTGT